MTRIQDKSREAYQSEPMFPNSQKLQLNMLMIPHNKSSTVWGWHLVSEQGNDLHGFHIHETFALPDEQL